LKQLGDNILLIHKNTYCFFLEFDGFELSGGFRVFGEEVGSFFTLTGGSGFPIES